MKATLSAPLTLNPQQATELVVTRALLNFESRTVAIDFELRDVGGAVVSRRSIEVSTNAVKNWLTNQETTIYNALLTKLGITGTVA